MTSSSKRSRDPEAKLLAAFAQVDAQDAWAAHTVGYQMPFFSEACLPRRMTKGQSVLRINGQRSYEIRSYHKVGLPYGTYPRLISYWLATQVRLGEGPRIDLGESFAKFQKVLNIRSGGGHHGPWKAVMEQVQRLVLTTVTMTSGEISDQKGWKSSVRILASESHLWSSRKGFLKRGEIILSDEVYTYLKTHASPIDMRAIHALRASPLALDIYCWLTARMFRARSSSHIKWIYLAEQFGVDSCCGELSGRKLMDFRNHFTEMLRRIKVLWPELRYSVTTEKLVLYPCSPHVPTRAVDKAVEKL